MILRARTQGRDVGKRTRAYLPQKTQYIFMIFQRAHAREQKKKNSYALRLDRWRSRVFALPRASVLALLFNLVCAHIVRVHAINLYSGARATGSGRGERERECTRSRAGTHAAQNAREKFPYFN